MVAVSKRVLVVDDEQIVRDSCERVLKNAGYEVQTVCNGRDALAAEGGQDPPGVEAWRDTLRHRSLLRVRHRFRSIGVGRLGNKSY